MTEPDPAHVTANARYLRASALRDGGELARAAGVFEEAATGYGQAGDLEHQAAALVEAGLCHKRLLQPRAAMERYEDTIAVLSRWAAATNHPKARTHLARVHTNLAQTLHDLGEEERALAAFDDALNVAEHLDELEYAWITNSIGRLYREMKRPLEARRLLTDALRVFRDHGDHRNGAHAAMNLGAVHNDLGEHTEALSSFDAALDAYKLLADERFATLARVNIAAQQLKLGMLEEGLATIDAALALLQDPQAEIWRATALSTKSRLQWLLGDRDASLATLREAADLNESHGQLIEYAALIGEYGGRLIELGRADDGVSFAEFALDELERSHDRLRSNELRAQFLDRIAEAFGRVVQAYIDAGRAGEAFMTAERSKARTLALLLMQIREASDDEVLHSVVALERELGAVRAKLSATPGAHEVKRLERREDELRLRLRVEEARFGASLDPEDRSWASFAHETVDQLPDQVLLVEYVVGESRSGLIASLNGEVESHRVAGAEELERRIIALRDSVQRGSLPLYANTLYRDLLEPVEHLLERSNELLIVPDGVLYSLPFALLMRTSPVVDPATNEMVWSECDWLVATHTLRYSPSAAVAAQLLRRRNRRTPPERNLAAFAVPGATADEDAVAAVPADARRVAAALGAPLDPLPFAFEEAAGIVRAFGYTGELSPPVRLDGDTVAMRSHRAATKNAITEVAASGSYRYWHFACHGLVDFDLPDHSGLVVAGDRESQEEPYWRAYEVASASLPCELVTLSACDTGRGRTLRGEGVLGLSRAFLRAGADAVCASLWPVYDHPTAQLMEAFYTQLVEGRDKTEALRLVQLDAIAADVHPRHWSPFVLIGTP